MANFNVQSGSLKRVSPVPIRFQPEGGYLMARLGSRNDGGYLVPAHAVARSDYLLSFGLSLDWEFERQFDAVTSLKALHCYDHTVTRAGIARLGGAATLKAMIGSVPRKRLPTIKLALSYFRFFGQGHVRHFPLAIRPRDGDGARSFETAVGMLSQTATNVFLKCDIEGGEYGIADQIEKRSSALTGMVIEFHEIADDPARFYGTLDALMSRFVIVHIHANNCVPLADSGIADVVEVSFLNRLLASEIRGLDTERSLVGAGSLSMDVSDLDAPNTTTADEIVFRYV